MAARPEVKLEGLLNYVPRGTNYSKEVVAAVETEIKYKGYIEREKEIAEKLIADLESSGDKKAEITEISRKTEKKNPIQ